jgi:hypothetical protein
MVENMVHLPIDLFAAGLSRRQDHGKRDTTGQISTNRSAIHNKAQQTPSGQ